MKHTQQWYTVMNTENVKTTDLKISDVVHFYGGRFELVSRLYGPDEAASTVAYYIRNNATDGRDMESVENLRVFRGKYIGDVSPFAPCSIPHGYFTAEKDDEPGSKYWNFQGNHRASWTRES